MLQGLFGTVVAASLLATPAHAGDRFDSEPVPDTFILTALLPQPSAPPGSSAFVRLDIADDGTQTLIVRVLGLTAGDYDAVLGGPPGGSVLGTFAVDASGMGQFSPDPPKFDDFFTWFQFQLPFDIRLGSEVLLTGDLNPPGGSVVLDDDVSAVNGARLIAVGDDLDARGQLVFRSSFGKERVDVRLERLTPGPYVVDIAGQPTLLMDVGLDGKAQLRERVPVKPGWGEITFHPVGQDVRVRDANGAVVLAARMPYDPFEDWSRPPGRQKFAKVGKGAADGLRVDFLQFGYVGYGGLERGWLVWERDASGAATVTAKILGQDFLPADPYGIYLNDVWIGEVVEYVSDDDDPFANTFSVGPEIDLRGQRLEVRDGDEVGLVLTFPQSVPAGVRAYHPEVRKPDHLHLDLLNPGIDLDATGLLDWKRAKSGAERLALTVRDLPAGAYDIVLDGVLAAAGALTVDEDGGSTHVLFSSTGKPPSAQLLEFEVHGTIELRASGTSTTYLLQELDG